MKKYSIIGILAVIAMASQAQIIDNKLNLYIGYTSGSFNGKETSNEDNFISPSLYSNYSILSGFSTKGLLNYKTTSSVGLLFEYLVANEWESTNYTDYDNSETQLFSISPLYRFHNKFSKKGLANRLNLFVECGPVFGLSRLILSEPLFNIQPKTDASTPPMRSNDFFYGFKGGIGTEYTIKQGLGIYINYFYDYNWISSKIHNDINLSRSIISVGLVLKLQKNKMYLF